MSKPADERFREFMDRPDSRLILTVLTVFVQNVIPDPEATVGTGWVVSCLPGTPTGTADLKRLAVITSHTTEMLVIEGVNDPGYDFGGFLNVGWGLGPGPSTAPPEILRSFRDRGLVDDRTTIYPGIGSGVTRILADRAEDFYDLLTDEAVVDGAARLYQFLSDRGDVLNARGHNRELADAILADIQTLDADSPA